MTDPVNPSSNPTSFEAYIESWNSNYQTVIDGMPMQNGMTVDISFDNWGTPLDSWTQSQVVGIYNGLEAKAQAAGVSINIKLSFGGATYPMPGLSSPQDASNLANQVSGVLTAFANLNPPVNFSGIDLDIESSNNPESYVADFIQDLRGNLGSDKIISLTIPGQAWSGFYYNLATDPKVESSVDSYQFMEYDIYDTPGVSFEDQIKADINTYIGPKGTASAWPNTGAPCWGLPPSKIHLGLMTGNDDLGNNLSPQAATDLAQFAVDKGLGGVMIWDFDRDAGYNNTTGGPAWPPFEYSNDILSVLNSQDYEP